MKEGETWKNVYVNALKQLRFDRSPEVFFSNSISVCKNTS